MAGVSNFYMRVEWTGHSAVIWVSDRGEWRLIHPELASSWWPPGQPYQMGSFHDSNGAKEGFVACYGRGNDMQDHLFSLSSLHFDAVKLGQTAERFDRWFRLGKDWARVNPRSPAGQQNINGNWFAILSGPLLNAAKEQLAEAQKQFQDFCIDAGLNAVSFVDPTGISAVVLAERASEKGDYLGCALALVSVIPVARQVAAAAKGAALAAKIDRLLMEMRALENALRVSTAASRDFRLTTEGTNIIRAEVQTDRKLQLVYDSGKAARETKVAVHVAEATVPIVKPLANGYVFRTWSDGRFVTREVAGELLVPSKLAKVPRNSAELRKISSGTGEHAGHLAAHRFGGPDVPENLGLQNPNMNSWSPKDVRNEFYCTDGGASYYKLEDEWAEKLEEGWKIKVTIRDKYRVGETRPAYREVLYTETSPKGVVTDKNLSFGNWHSPQSRGEWVPPRWRKKK
jgi:hypothetical protein